MSNATPSTRGGNISGRQSRAVASRARHGSSWVRLKAAMVPTIADTMPTVPLIRRLFLRAGKKFGLASIACHQRSDKASIGKADCGRLVKAKSTTSTSGDRRNRTNSVPTPAQRILEGLFIAAAIATEDRGRKL